jgi:hypothetical protein
VATPIAVPPLYRRALVALAALPREEWLALGESLTSGERLLTTQELEERVERFAPSFDESPESLIAAALSLSAQRVSDPRTAAEVAEGVSLSPQLEMTSEARQDVKERLSKLLTVSAVRLAAKALDLAGDYEHLFVDARILTDVRPVFPDDETKAPAAAVIVDTLKINYYGPDGNLRSFHVALDQAELDELRKVIVRGLEKTRGMRSFLDSARLAYWEGDENDDG